MPTLRPLNHDDGDQSHTSFDLSPITTSHEPPASKMDRTQDRMSSSLHSEGSVDPSQRNLSIDTDYDCIGRSPILEHEHALASSGLPRIRQERQSRAASLPLNPSTGPPSLTASQSNASSITSTYPSHDTASPILDNLHKFPSESLHSFSFAKQSEEMLHVRHNVLKRSIDFMRDRFGWAASSSGLATTQARLSGDPELQSMVDLVAKANLLEHLEGPDRYHGLLGGPVTGPPDLNGDNIFDKAFGASASPSLTPKKHTEPEGRSVDSEAIPGQLLTPEHDDLTGTRRKLLNSAPSSRRVSLKRTYTDLSFAELQNKLTETIAQPYSATDLLSPSTSSLGVGPGTPTVHSHSSKYAPTAQAVFRTEAKAPWTILAANDLACLVFGVTQKELRRSSFLDFVQKERRPWLESKLNDTVSYPATGSRNPSPTKPGGVNTRSLGLGNGVTARLLSEPSSRQRLAQRSQGHNGNYIDRTENTRSPNHSPRKSRGVLLCGDVVPIQKRNGCTGSASLWVMEKKGGLIWVVEEIVEHVAYLRFDERGLMIDSSGNVKNIWGPEAFGPGTRIFDLLPRVPTVFTLACEEPDFSKIFELKHFAAVTSGRTNIPIAVTPSSGPRALRISSFPHMAGMMVLSPKTLHIVSANPVFSAALFGNERPDGSHITDLIPNFGDFLDVLTEHDNIPLVDGVVIPEHSFRRARALLVLRDGKIDTASLFLRPTGLPATHRDGSEIMVDIQMRVVKSESAFLRDKETTSPEPQEPVDGTGGTVEVVFALWITYSQHLHSANKEDLPHPNRLLQPTETPPASLSPGQRSPEFSPKKLHVVGSASPANTPRESLLSQKLSEAASEPLTDRPVEPVPELKVAATKVEAEKKKTISDYVILEDMGQGAYGQVKLARSKLHPAKKVVLKYVTKKRILVDTWTRDRKLGTVPLEIHVLNFLRRDELRHPNIVEMEGFFEDEINYYIEMVPHGLPGMDLFDYVELRSNMDEAECRSIFGQVVSAIHHLHTKASVVHRDIKDENVILDGERRIKLIDFGSAAYIKNGPFDVFVGTIDYAAPEVLQGRSYRGKEQDVWALGILLYTIIYKENPFYNVNEIMDHPLRIPFLPFTEDCIDLIRGMLNRDVDERLTITEVTEHPWMRSEGNRPGHAV